MKIKSEFVLRQIAGTWIIFSLEQNVPMPHGVMTLNDAGALLWGRLEQGCSSAELVSALTDEYEVTAQQAQNDVDEFLQKLRNAGCLAE